jgi:hypothetical protein
MKVLVIFAVFLLRSFGAGDDRDEMKCDPKFCEEDPNYPERILNGLELWRFKFDRNPVNLRAKRSIDFNSDAYIVEAKLCKMNIALNRPQKLRNVDGILRTIVNHQNYTQIVRMETCISENFPCTGNIYPKSVRSFCHQNYDPVTLVAFDDRKNCLVTEKFNVPSSCACAIDKEDFFKGVSRDLQRP